MTCPHSRLGWLIDSEVCRCDGTEHFHARCRDCGARKVFPEIWANEWAKPGVMRKYAKKGGMVTAARKREAKGRFV
jgi:hypothetical protein